MFKLTQFIVQDLVKNWILLFFCGFLLLTSFGLFTLEGQADKALLGILNLCLLVLPMMAVVFSTIYYYNMYEFIVLMLAQPIKRWQVLESILLGLGIVFSLCVGIGIGIPVLIMNGTMAAWVLLGVALLLSWVFVALAILAGAITRDKARGMGLALLFWVYFVLIFDGLVLMLMYNFSDYPIEKLVLGITFLNPIDLGRIMVLMQTDAAALMGYSGAVFRHFFEAWWSVLVALTILGVWALLPTSFSIRLFQRKDL